MLPDLSIHGDKLFTSSLVVEKARKFICNSSWVAKRRPYGQELYLDISISDVKCEKRVSVWSSLYAQMASLGLQLNF